MVAKGSTEAACLFQMASSTSLAAEMASVNGANTRSGCAPRYHLIPQWQTIFINAKKDEMASPRLLKPMQKITVAGKCRKPVMQPEAHTMLGPGAAGLCNMTDAQDHTWVKRSPTAVISAVRAMPMLSIMIRATHIMTGVPKRCSQPDITVSPKLALFKAVSSKDMWGATCRLAEWPWLMLPIDSLDC